MTTETDPCEVKLKAVRLSFSDQLFEPEQGDKRKTGKHAGKIPWRWSANFLIPKDTPEGKAIAEACAAAMMAAREKEWPGQDIKIKTDKRAMRDGEEESWDGYAGHWYVSAGRTSYSAEGAGAPKRPYKIVDSKRNEEGVFPELTESDGRPYAGCYVTAIVRFFAQDDPEYGKRINASIEAVQFWKHGAAFGGGRKVDVNSAFDEADEDGDVGDDRKPQASGSDVMAGLG